jgi:hypothetical protein
MGAHDLHEDADSVRCYPGEASEGVPKLTREIRGIE